MITIETDRLILRPFTYTDLDDLYEYAKNPNVGPNAGWKPHEDLDESMAILKNFIGNEVLGLSGRPIISLQDQQDYNDQLRTADKVKVLGYVLSEDYWGKYYH